MKINFAILLISLLASVPLYASTQVFNHTPYPMKVVLSGLFIGKQQFEVAPGATKTVLTGILSCVIITKCKIWIKESNMDDYAQEPTINQKVYLDRCFKEIHVIETPNELGEYAYSITTSNKSAGLKYE